MDALVAVAIVSIAVNPLLFRAAAALEERFAGEAGAEPAAGAQTRGSETGERPLPLVLTGLGALGRQLARRCIDSGLPVRVIDSDPEALEALRSRGIPAVLGTRACRKTSRRPAFPRRA